MVITGLITIPKGLQKAIWFLQGRCENCGSDNIHVWSWKKAKCNDCGKEN